LLVNPLELSLAAGLPIALVAARGVMASLYRWNASSDPSERRQVALCLALTGTWLLLLLSGKNQGEAARLWCFLMPWVLLCATNAFDQEDSAASRSDFRRLLICQLLVAVLTVGTVSGFSF
jgi:tetrahydromethanopterin S-methyltransferase subunit C